MIFFVWFISIIVSLAPQFGWKDPEYLERIEQQKCMVSQDVAYQVIAVVCADLSAVSAHTKRLKRILHMIHAEQYHVTLIAF